ncbi:MAG: EAL domain-containing protein [Alphaproteobacteria bacterium]|nr:EAL domain-containing protein [Alphaproteobacteria bacterium]
MEQNTHPPGDAAQDVIWRPALADGEAPLCYLIDCEPGVRRLVGSVLDRYGVALQSFDTLEEMESSRQRCEPQLVLVDVTCAVSAALALVDRLAAAAIACPVQLISGLNPVLLEQIHRHGGRRGLQMLPPLLKPLQGAALARVIDQLRLRRDALATTRVTLEEVLAQGWLELWYQPAIDLKQRKLVGAEAFARARHPELGVLAPDAFLPGASESSLIDLTRRVLGRALHDWSSFATIGVPIELSINVPLVALTKLSVFGILWEQKPDAPQWPGLTLEISEDEAIENLTLVKKAVAELRSYRISMAIDNFGPRYAEFCRWPDLPFTAIKIDRSYIAGCDTDPVNLGLCETIVGFARKFNVTSAAEGIETGAELQALRDIGCEVGQGYFFARPQPKSELVTLLRKRLRPAA